MQLFDLHADTATKLFYNGLSFDDTALQLSANDLSAFEEIHQVFACFSNNHLDDEQVFLDFFSMRNRLLSQVAPYRKAGLSPILAVEDARLLGKKRDRLRMLAEAGVAILTLVWKGETQIGGAFDTDVGLSEFGGAILLDCFSCGIVPDASHASVPAFFEIAEAAEQSHAPFIASHSNARAIADHPRNLTNEQFLAVKQAHGLVGISLCPAHLNVKGEADIFDVALHIEHWLSLGGEETVAIGTDFDGVDSLPRGISHCRDLIRLAELLSQKGYTDSLIENIFYKNAERFFGKYRKKQEPL